MQPDGTAQASSPLQTAAKPKRNNNLKEVAIVISLPWLIFFLVICLFLFTYNDLAPLVWTLLLFCTALAFLFVGLGFSMRKRVFVALGLLCLSSVVTGTTVGLWLDSTYLAHYYVLEGGDELRDVVPTVAPPAGKEPASIYHFANGTFVDDMRTVGFVKEGRIYCVAPVSLPGAFDATVEYWATGQDCCERRGHFDCGTAREPGALVGVVAAASNRAARNYFDKAVEQAEDLYGATSSNASGSPRLVAFVHSAAAVEADLWNEALSICLATSCLNFLTCCMAGLILAKVLQKTNQKAT